MNKALMRMLAESMSEEDEKKPALMSIEGQKENITEFLKPHSLKVGDYVRLNHWGKEKYKMPYDGMVAIVSRVYDAPALDDDDHTIHGEVAIIHPEAGVPAGLAFDFRYLRLDKKKDGTD